MISIVEPKNSAAISERKCSNGFAYKLKWDFHEVFLLLLFEEGETQVDFLLFVSFCVSASTIVADGHILSYSKRMSDKNNNNHNMALKQCFVLRDDIHKKTHQFFFSLAFSFFFFFPIQPQFSTLWCGLLSFACSNNTGLICNIPMNAIFWSRIK